MEDQKLLAAIGQVVVNAAVLEYQIAVLISVMEGADRDRALAIARRAGEAMRQLEKQAKAQPDRADLQQLHHNSQVALNDRHALVHSIAFADEPPGSEASYGIWIPRHDAEMPVSLTDVLGLAQDIRITAGRARAMIDAETARAKP